MMTEQLHRLIDTGAAQPVINERMAGLIESGKRESQSVREDLSRIGSDHEKRIRALERSISYGLGAIGLIAVILQLISALK